MSKCKNKILNEFVLVQMFSASTLFLIFFYKFYSQKSSFTICTEPALIEFEFNLFAEESTKNTFRTLL